MAAQGEKESSSTNTVAFRLETFIISCALLVPLGATHVAVNCFQPVVAAVYVFAVDVANVGDIPRH